MYFPSWTLANRIGSSALKPSLFRTSSLVSSSDWPIGGKEREVISAYEQLGRAVAEPTLKDAGESSVRRVKSHEHPIFIIALALVAFHNHEMDAHSGHEPAQKEKRTWVR